MLRTVCPFTAQALATSQRRARFAAAFGSFWQRTIDRRYCGLLAVARPGALEARTGPQNSYSWYYAAVDMVGGYPSHRVWSPFSQVAPLGSFSCTGGGPY